MVLLENSTKIVEGKKAASLHNPFQRMGDEGWRNGPKRTSQAEHRRTKAVQKKPGQTSALHEFRHKNISRLNPATKKNSRIILE